MSLTGILKSAAEKLGFHVVRNHRNPAHTLMGLDPARFGAVLDAGANVGQFVKAMLPRFPRAVFHCFEPVPSAFRELSGWAAGDPRVIAVQTALGDQSGSLEMRVHGSGATSSSLLPTTPECERLYPHTAEQASMYVPVRQLDDYVAGLAAPLASEVFLKIDVQGYEAPVLRGAAQVLKATSACLLEVSLAPLYRGQSRFDELVGLLGLAGLDYAGNFDQAYDAAGQVVAVDALFLRGTG